MVISAQYSQYGSKVIASTERDATYVLDEILANETDLEILEHATDTGKIKRTYKNRRGSRRIFILNNYDGYWILSQFICLK